MTENATHSWLVRMGDAGSLEDIARLRTDGQYTMQAVTQRTGVPPDTLRSWERRYGFPEPARTGSNRRLYSERDIAAIGWLLVQTERGQGTSEAIRMLLAALDDDANDPAPVQESLTVTAHVATPGLPLPVDDLVLTLTEGRLAAAQRAWDRLALAVSVDALCVDVLLPVDREIRNVLPNGPLRRRATAFLLRKATVLLDHAGPDLAGPAIALIADDDARVATTVLGTMLARANHAIITPIGDLSLDTLALIRHADPARTIVVTGEAPSADRIAAFAAAASVPLALWRPEGGPIELPGADALPADPHEVVAALTRTR